MALHQECLLQGGQKARMRMDELQQSKLHMIMRAQGTALLVVLPECCLQPGRQRRRRDASAITCKAACSPFAPTNHRACSPRVDQRAGLRPERAPAAEAMAAALRAVPGACLAAASATRRSQRHAAAPSGLAASLPQQPWAPGTLRPAQQQLRQPSIAASRRRRRAAAPAAVATTGDGSSCGGEPTPPAVGAAGGLKQLLRAAYDWLCSIKPPKSLWRSIAALVLGGEALVRILQGETAALSLLLCVVLCVLPGFCHACPLHAWNKQHLVMCLGSDIRNDHI